MLKLMIKKNNEVTLLDKDDDLITKGDFYRCLMTLTRQKGYEFVTEDVCSATTKLLNLKDLIVKLETFKKIMRNKINGNS